MATNGTITGSVTNKATIFSFYVEWTATPNMLANASTVVVKSYWKTTTTAQTWVVSGTNNYVNLIVGGVTQSDSWSQTWNLNPWPSNPYLARISTFTVSHNANGFPPTVVIDVRLDGTASTYGPSISKANGAINSYMESTVSACAAPTALSVNPTLTENVATLSWSGAASGINNAVSSYEIQYNDSFDGFIWGPWTTLVTVITSATSGSYTVTPSGTRGAYRLFQVRTCGSAGSSYYSDWKISSNTVRRNILPTAPTTAAALPLVYTGLDVSVQWDGAAAGTSEISSYIIEQATSENGTSWSSWAQAASVNAASSSATIQATQLPGTYTKYRILAVDTLGAQSSPTETNAVMASTVPSAPNIISPASSQAVTFNTNSYIVLRVGGSAQKPSQKLMIQIDGGQWYNSISNPEMFFPSGYSAYNTVVIFKTPALLVGSHAVTAKTVFSGFSDESAEAARSFSVSASPFSNVEAETQVKASDMTAIRTAANSIRQYFGLSTVSWAEPIIAWQTYSNRWIYHISEIRQAVIDVINTLRGYNAAGAALLQLPDWVSTGSGAPCADVINQIQDIISTL